MESNDDKKKTHFYDKKIKVFDFKTGKILYNEKVDEIFQLFRMMQTGPNKQVRYEHEGVPKNITFNLSPTKTNKVQTNNPTRRKIGRNERYEGVKSVISNTQVFFSSSKQFDMYPIEKREYENGYRLTKQILGDKYDAYIGNNDMTALGILACLKDHNIKTSVAGFDNIPETDFPQIQLTTVDHGACEKGKEAVDILLEQTKSERKRIVHMEYEPQLIIRLSTFNRKKSSSQ